MTCQFVWVVAWFGGASYAGLGLHCTGFLVLAFKELVTNVACSLPRPPIQYAVVIAD